MVNISILEKEPRFAITRLGLMLKRMSLHVLYPSNFDSLREKVVEPLCLLEQEFTPKIFKHLLMDLQYEIDHCGPVRTRWMYPIEGYMKVLKSFVHTREK